MRSYADMASSNEGIRIQLVSQDRFLFLELENILQMHPLTITLQQRPNLVKDFEQSLGVVHLVVVVKLFDAVFELMLQRHQVQQVQVLESPEYDIVRIFA